MTQKWLDKTNEKKKPDIKPDVLNARRAKATALKAAREQQQAELKKKYSVSSPGDDICRQKFLDWTAKTIHWREKFRAYREKQKAFSQWIPKDEFFPLVVYGGAEDPTSISTFNLSNYKETSIPHDEGYKFFDRTWMQYDTNGSGKLSYQEFEGMLRDIGFVHARPSRREVDPARTGKVSWENAVQWWYTGVEPAEKTVQRVSNAKRKAARKQKEQSYMFKVIAADLFTKKQASRARKNARIKNKEKSQKLREFIKKNRGKRWGDAEKGERLILDVSFVVKSGKGKVEYDVTDYKPVELDSTPQQQRTVDLVWRQYDKQGVGTIDYDTFQKLAKENNLSETPFAKGKEVKFDDFIQWWFKSPDKTTDQASPEEKQEETPEPRPSPSKKKVQLLPRNTVKSKAKEFQKRFALERSKFRKFRKKQNASTPKKQKQKDRVIIKTKKEDEQKEFEYNNENYIPAFIPAGKQIQFEQLDRVWKKNDTEGIGKLDVDDFRKMLSQQGLKCSKETLEKLQDSETNVSFEKFATWWFSKSQGVVPHAPPTPADKKQKVKTTRSSLAAIHGKFNSKYKLASPEEFSKSVLGNSRQIALEKSLDFKKWRLEQAKNPDRVYDWDIEIQYNDPGLVVQGKGITA